MHPKLREVDWSRLKLAAGGGSQIVPTVSERWKAITGQMIREGYGLSETSPIVTFNPAAVADVRAGKQQAVGFLTGQVMRQTRGQANAALVGQLLREALEEA